MVQNMHHGTYANLHGVPVGQPIRSPFNPVKHLESNSMSALVPVKSRYLGILNTLTAFNKVKTPFLSMTELKKNVMEVDGPNAVLEFLVPFKTGCPFLIDSLVQDNPTPGKYNQPFQIVLNTNAYTYGDVITPDYRNGKQLRIQPVDPNDPETEIREFGNGYIYTVALDSYDEEDYFPQEFLEEGTIFMKIDNIDGGEFGGGWTSVGGGPRVELQPYTYALGDSTRAIHSWVTSDASYKKYKLDHPDFPSLAHLDGASTDVLTYFTTVDGRPKGVYWVPELIEKMAAELARMHEKALLFQQGTVFTSNGREKIRVGLGYYQQIKQRGNYDTYATSDQLFSLIMQGAERLFSIHNRVPVDDRVIKIRAGSIAYRDLMTKFKQYFQTDNPFTVMADHPALIKANMITYSEKTGILYRPLDFKALFIPEMGTVILEQDTTLDEIDDYLEHPKQAARGSLSGGMVFIEDVSADDFTNAIPKGVKIGDKTSIKNVSLIKQEGKEDGINYRVGGMVSETLKKMLGIDNGGVVADWNKTLEIAMWTHGELYVHDPSRCWIIEYDPYGDIAFNNRNISRYKTF